MKVTTYRTKKIVLGDSLYEILDEFLPKLKEGDVVAIVSKIIAICQGDVVKKNGKITKDQLRKKESDYYLPDSYTMFGIPVTIKNNSFGTGIDESNGNGYFILAPKNLQKTTNEIWEYLKRKNKIKNLGVIVTDGRIIPLRKGVVGVGLSWCGFKPLRSYIGKSDIFGHKLMVTKTNLVDSLAAAAVVETGEGIEQTPLAVISDPRVEFVQRTPTKKEISEMNIKMEQDVFGKILTSVKWIKGK